MATRRRPDSAGRQMLRVRENLPNIVGGGVVLNGADDLIVTLRDLDNIVFKRVVKYASERSMRVVLKDARKNARKFKQSGLLWKSLGVKTKMYSRSRVVYSVVGPRKGFGATVNVVDKQTGKTREEYRDPLRYGHLVENDTAPHALGKGSKLFVWSNNKRISRGQQSGRMHPGTTGRHFLLNALNKNKDTILSIFRAQLGAGIEREAKRAAKIPTRSKPQIPSAPAA
jgi:hypothetical protein